LVGSTHGRNELPETHLSTNKSGKPVHSPFEVIFVIRIIHLGYFATAKMVLLTMTPSIVEGLHTLNRAAHGRQATTRPQGDDEPSLGDPAIGNPVSHSQVVDMWKDLKDARHGEYTLEMLLKGANVYVPPPAPKPEPVS
jgi:hypothetical protein